LQSITETTQFSESEACTRGIRVSVRACFMPERSSPERGEWFFAYRIRISNEGNETVQLESRHWLITDGHGQTEEVRGRGVVGEEPILDPGSFFEYTSQCPLPTPVGSMIGRYQMVTSRGERFDAEIARFRLSVPGTVH
jgi:ApaG protein